MAIRHDPRINSFDDDIEAAETSANRLACQALAGPMRDSFLALDTEAKLVGLSVLAHIAGDEGVRDAALLAIAALRAS